MTILNKELVAKAATMTAAESRYATAIEAWRKCGAEAHVELIESELAVAAARQGFSHELQLARSIEVRAAMFAYLDRAVSALDPAIDNAWLRAEINRDLGEVMLKVVAGFGSHWANVHSNYPLSFSGLEKLIEDVELNWLG